MGKIPAARGIVIPGRMRPFHLGHDSKIERGLREYDAVVLAVGVDPERDKHGKIVIRNGRVAEKVNASYPFTFSETERAIRLVHPDSHKPIIIVPVYDQHHDGRWRQHMDEVLKEAERMFKINVGVYASDNPHVIRCMPARLTRVWDDAGMKNRKWLEGAKIRERIRLGLEPSEWGINSHAAEYYKSIGARDRLIELHGQWMAAHPKKKR